MDAAAPEQLLLFLGNDTGACTWPRRWACPVSRSFRAEQPGRMVSLWLRASRLSCAGACEGCMLITCVERQMECVCRVAAEDVCVCVLRGLIQRLSAVEEKPS